MSDETSAIARGTRALPFNRAERFHKLSEISAIARGVVESLKARIQKCFRQSDAARLRSICKNYFVPLNRGNFVVEAGDRATTEKCARCFRRSKDRHLDFVLGHDAAHRALTHQLVIQSALKIDIMIFEIDRLQPRVAPGKLLFFL